MCLRDDFRFFTPLCYVQNDRMSTLPNLFWPIFRAEYDGDSEETQEPDDYELSSEFVPVADLDRSALTAAELAYLDQAIHARRWTPA